jgi:hypothetical protein
LANYLSHLKKNLKLAHFGTFVVVSKY